MLQQQRRITPQLPISLLTSPEVKMEVVFGTPSQNCIGSGVCMLMNRAPRLQPLRCPHAPVWISFRNGRLVFRFAKIEVTREDSIARFDSPWFLVQEPFEIPRLTARSLGLQQTQVPPGIYSIEETTKDWYLTFPIQQ